MDEGVPLDLQILRYTPISILCEQFTPQDVQNITYTVIKPPESVTQHGMLLYLILGEDAMHGYTYANVPLGWLMEYLWFLFDYTALDVNMTVGRLKYGITYDITPLDWLYTSQRVIISRIEPVSYLLKKGAISCMSLSWLLRFLNPILWGSGRDDMYKNAQFLLDLGANTEYTKEENIIHFYHSRQTCLKQCIVFIGCISKRRLDLKNKILHKDVYTFIGKMMWEQRFD